MAIITGRTSNVVKKRAENLGVAHFYQGAEDKLVAFNDLRLKKWLSSKPMRFYGGWCGGLTTYAEMWPCTCTIPWLARVGFCCNSYICFKAGRSWHQLEVLWASITTARYFWYTNGAIFNTSQWTNDMWFNETFWFMSLGKRSAIIFPIAILSSACITHSVD